MRPRRQYIAPSARMWQADVTYIHIPGRGWAASAA